MKSLVQIGIAFGITAFAASAVDGVVASAGHGKVFLAGHAGAQSVSPALFERARPIIADHMGVDRTAVTPDTDIFIDLGADELDLIELVMAMEEEFGVELSDDQVEGAVTVGDLLAAVQAAGGR